MIIFADSIIAATLIHTFDPAQPTTQGMALRDGRILAVGPMAELEAYRGPDTAIETIKGTITPGLTDAHTHVVMGTIWTRGLNLTDLSLAQVRERLSTQAAQTIEGAWLMGWGLDPNVFPADFDGRIFDEATSARPAFLRMRDGHSAVANSAAIELAGLTGSERFRDESAVGVDAQGDVSGYLLEFSAMDLVLRHCPAESIPQLGQRLLKRLRDMANTGLTATHVLDFEPPAAEVLRWVEAHAELPLRLRFSPMVNPGTSVDDWERIAAAQGSGGRRWLVDGVKFMIDGTIDNGSAWLEHPDHFGQGRKSIWTDTDDYRAALKFFAERGICTATHAIGDRGVQFVLDSLEALGPLRERAQHRIEHIETIPDGTLERFATLGVAASMQPIHGTHHTKADRSDNWSQRLGDVRAARGWRCKDLRNSGAIVALGSDWPITPYDPREMMADAVLRRPVRRPEVDPVQPEQGLSVLEAFEGYTSHAARASNLQHDAGTLSPGRRADFTVFESDPLSLTGEELADVRIVATFLDGHPARSGAKANR
ncbi:amidohydrolase [Glutamicibacter endophyticus]